MRNGLDGFTSSVLRENQRMQTVFNHSGYGISAELSKGIYTFTIDFKESQPTTKT